MQLWQTKLIFLIYHSHVMVLSNTIQINAKEITNYSCDLSKGGFSKRLFHNMLPCGYWTLIYKLYCSQTHSRQHDILLVLPQTSTILAQKNFVR